jgi:hypothetical protein
MSQRMVGVVVDKLLADEELRCRFLVDRLEILAELCLGGVELRPDEVAVLPDGCSPVVLGRCHRRRRPALSASC